MAVEGSSATEDMLATPVFADSQPAAMAPGAESADGTEARESGRRRRRGGRGGRDRDDARGAATDGDTPLEPNGVPTAADDDRVPGDEVTTMSDADTDADAMATVPTEGGERDGRRRSRGGRNRRDRGERGEPRADAAMVGDLSADPVATDDGAPAAATAAAPVSVPVAVPYSDTEAPAVTTVPARPQPVAFKSMRAPAAEPLSSPPADPAEPAATTATHAAESAPASVAASLPTPQAAVVAAAPASAGTAAFVLETDALQAVAATAGLQWVNSDADKMRAAQAAMADELPPAPVVRVPKPEAVVDDGPLVLVETRRDLSQVKLPFEA